MKRGSVVVESVMRSVMPEKRLTREETLSKRRERNARHKSRLTSVEQASERTRDRSRRKIDTGQERGHRLDDQ